MDSTEGGSRLFEDLKAADMISARDNLDLHVENAFLRGKLEAQADELDFHRSGQRKAHLRVVGQ